MISFSRILRTSADSTFRVLENGQLGVITLTRSEARNAFSLQMSETIHSASAMASAKDSTMKALILTGEHSVFCAGRDLKASLHHTPIEADEYLTSALSAVNSLLATPIPIIVSIERICIGLGFELALAGDLRICGRSTQLGFPEIGLSLFPGCGGGVMLPALLGNVSLASDWILTGKRILADEALTHGAISRVVDDGQALDESIAIASELITKNRDLLIKTKAVVKHDFNRKVNSDWWSLSERLRREVGRHPDHKEALHRFVHRSR